MVTKRKQCEAVGCVTSPRFNFKGMKPKFCSSHKELNMINVTIITCRYIDCDSAPRYNLIGKTDGLFCAKHKSDLMVNVKKITCHEEGCNTSPSFNYEGETKLLYCNAHKKDEMVNVKKDRCVKIGCIISPCFNYEGESKLLYCGNHKKEGMINIKKDICTEDECDLSAIYNYEGQTKPLFCANHKVDLMINIHGKKCIEPNCGKRPTYNFSGCDAKYCATHKQNDMINVCSYRCIELNCQLQPSFNYEGQIRPIYCSIHMEPDMIDLVHKRKCNEKNCKVDPSFNYKGINFGLYCAKHCEPGMINIKHKLCEDNECGAVANYGLPGNKSELCNTHKIIGMIKFPQSKCKINGCHNIALYGSNKKQIHCESHKLKDEINLIEKECISCKLPNILNKEKKCEYCDPVKQIIVRLAKQNKVKAYLDQQHFKYISCDKMIDKGNCIPERPDFLFDCITHYIVLEVDEHQHKERVSECETTRMRNIANALGMLTIFIRYNPDDFKINKKKINILPSDNERLKELDAQLTHYQKLDIEAIKKYGFLSVIYLYYDDYDKTKTSPLTLIEFEVEKDKPVIDVEKDKPAVDVKKKKKKDKIINENDAYACDLNKILNARPIEKRGKIRIV